MNSLHAALKDLYTRPGDRQEAQWGGYLIDVQRDDCLVEIQTANFSAIRQKLNVLCAEFPVLLVYPLAVEKWILNRSPGESGFLERRRRSPKRGRLIELFNELVHIPDLLRNPNFTLEVLLTRQEEIRLADGRGSWRRGGVSIVDRRLLEITERYVFHLPESLLPFLPPDLPEPFTNAQLAQALNIPPRLARKITYCLDRCGVLQRVGKQRNAILWQRPVRSDGFPNSQPLW